MSDEEAERPEVVEQNTISLRNRTIVEGAEKPETVQTSASKFEYRPKPLKKKQESDEASVLLGFISSENEVQGEPMRGSRKAKKGELREERIDTKVS